MPATVLLADANPVTRTDWETVLQDQGYSVIAVESGEALLDVCPGLQPDLILFNAQSPDVRGPEICSLLKADPRTSLTPVILVTGFSEDSGAAPVTAIADELWTGAPSRWEVLNRINSLLHIKSYIDDQATAVIVALARSIEARDRYTRGHCERLSILAVQFGRSLDMSVRDLEALRVGALIHDIGKVMLPDSILLKPGWLTLEETRTMEQHPIEGERICAPLRSLRDVLPIIRHHHERMDGSGYPDRLRRSLIPFSARVLQIVDIYDALTTDRTYRKSVPTTTALAMLAAEADRGWLEAALVNRFGSLVVARPPLTALARSVRTQNLRLA